MKKTRGSVSIYALLIMMVLLTASLGVGALSIGTLGRAKRETNSMTAFEAAQAGLEWTASQGFKELDQNNGYFVNSYYSLNSVLDPLASGVGGTGVISPSADATYAWITASATYNSTSRSVRMFVLARNVGIWNNAIFAGTGASGKAINGNVDIRGSVHILGDGEEYSDLNNNGHWDGAEPYTDVNKNGVWDPGEPYTDLNGDGVRNLAEPYNDTNHNGVYDPPLTQTDLNSSFSGNAYIGNHYSGMPIGLESLVPPPPKPGGIETLNAEVRVKHGQIGINGTATIGTLGLIDAGTSKNNVDGTYVNDGWTGNQGSSQVYSDNGTNNGYDLDNLAIDFPLLSGIGAQPYTEKGTNNVFTNQEIYLDQRAMTVAIPAITTSTASFSFGPDAKGNSISWNKLTGVLDIHGVIKVDGEIQIGSKDTIRYTGNGTFYSTSNIRIDGNFLPAPGTTFPTTARVGLIAKQDMFLAAGSGSSQLTMAGAFYAQGTIVSRKQNQIAGTFVANYYDMGTNVPNIYQVPALPQNMPPAMPGDKNYYTLKVKSWRQRDQTSLLK